jgi:hypothetical protein
MHPNAVILLCMILAVFLIAWIADKIEDSKIAAEEEKKRKKREKK